MKMIRKGLLLADPPSDKITITCNQPMLRSAGTLCYNNVTEDHNNFTVWGGKEGGGGRER